MTVADAGLGHRLAALRSDFAALGARAASAADSLALTQPPPTMLLDELSAATKAFAELRTAMLERAGALAVIVDDAQLGSLRDLEPVLAAIGSAEEHRARVAAWEEARNAAFALLDDQSGRRFHVECPTRDPVSGVRSGGPGTLGRPLVVRVGGAGPQGGGEASSSTPCRRA